MADATRAVCGVPAPRKPPERPVLTVAQVFELAERVGVRPVGNIRKLDSGEYRLRYRVKDGHMRRFPQPFSTRQEAERVLWNLAEDRHADVTRDGRLRALILLTAFASLWWGEVTALKRRDVDMVDRTVRVRGAYIEQANGRMTLGPTKSRAGLRTVAIPDAIVPLVAHLTKYTKKDDDALVFTGVKGGPLRRSGFNKITRWKPVVEALGVPNLHFHDLRAHGQHPRGRHGRLTAQPDGAHGPRQRAGGAAVSAPVQQR